METPLSASAQKMQKALAALGMSFQVVELPDTTRSAVEAAKAIGCEVGQIAKSLIFQTSQTHQPVLISASCPNRVTEQKMDQFPGEAIEKANADFVRKKKGFASG